MEAGDNGMETEQTEPMEWFWCRYGFILNLYIFM